MYLVCITNECTAVNILEQSFFSEKSVHPVYIKYIIIIIIIIIVVITDFCISNPIHSDEYVVHITFYSSMSKITNMLTFGRVSCFTTF